MQSPKSCPRDETENVPCPGRTPDEELLRVSEGEPVEFGFCSRCLDCWSGVRVEAGRRYAVEVVGLEGWRDGSWRADTVEQALGGWRDLSDPGFPQMGFLERLAKGPAIWLARRFRRMPKAEWFQVFIGVKPTASTDAVEGTETPPERLVESGQTFTPEVSGELYFFVNDLKSKYGNNQGRMRLRVSVVD